METLDPSGPEESSSWVTMYFILAGKKTKYRNLPLSAVLLGARGPVPHSPVTWAGVTSFRSPVTWAGVISFRFTSRLRLNPLDGQGPWYNLFQPPRIKVLASIQDACLLTRGKTLRLK